MPIIPLELRAPITVSEGMQLVEIANALTIIDVCDNPGTADMANAYDTLRELREKALTFFRNH